MQALENNFLVSGESPQAFAALAAQWTKAFPGTSPALEILREDLIQTDWLRRRARLLLQQLKFDLDSTGLPPFFWNSFVQSHVRFFEKHAAHTQSEFRKAFQLISALKAPPAKITAEPAAAPPVAQHDPRRVVQQNVRITQVDGKTVTEYDLKPEFFLQPDIQDRVLGLSRQFFFEDGFVPAEYAYVLEHDGLQLGPCPYVFISYRIEDACDICRREIETQSQHLLDGPRWGYDRPDPGIHGRKQPR
jgi:hypothetical protein